MSIWNRSHIVTYSLEENRPMKVTIVLSREEINTAITNYARQLGIPEESLKDIIVETFDVNGTSYSPRDIKASVSFETVSLNKGPYR